MKIIEKKILVTFIFCFVFIHIEAQKVKFRKLHYNYVCSIDTTGYEYIDTIYFYSLIKFKDVKDITEEINYFTWHLAIVQDSFLYEFVTMIIPEVEQDSIKFYSHAKLYSRQSINDNFFVYKLSLGDFKLPDNILFVDFTVDYTMKYHLKYHNKKPVSLKGNITKNKRKIHHLFYEELKPILY